MAIKDIVLPDGREIVIDQWLHYPLFSTVELGQTGGVGAAAASDPFDLKLFSYVRGQRVPQTANVPAAPFKGRIADERDTNMMKRAGMNYDEAFIFYGFTYEIFGLTDLCFDSIPAASGATPAINAQFNSATAPAAVPVNSPILWTTNPVTSTGAPTVAGGNITIVSEGLYDIAFQVPVLTGAQQLAIWVNGVSLGQNYRIGRSTGGSEIVGTFLVPLNAGDVVSLRNDAGTAAMAQESIVLPDTAAITFHLVSSEAVTPPGTTACIVDAPMVDATNLKRLDRDLMIELTVGAGQKAKPTVRAPWAYLRQSIGSPAWTSGNGVAPGVYLNSGTGGYITPKNQRQWEFPISIDSMQVVNCHLFSSFGNVRGLTQSLRFRVWMDGLKRRPID